MQHHTSLLFAHHVGSIWHVISEPELQQVPSGTVSANKKKEGYQLGQRDLDLRIGQVVRFSSVKYLETCSSQSF